MARRAAEPITQRNNQLPSSIAASYILAPVAALTGGMALRFRGFYDRDQQTLVHASLASRVPDKLEQELMEFVIDRLRLSMPPGVRLE